MKTNAIICCNFQLSCKCICLRSTVIQGVPVLFWPKHTFIAPLILRTYIQTIHLWKLENLRILTKKILRHIPNGEKVIGNWKIGQISEFLQNRSNFVSILKFSSFQKCMVCIYVLNIKRAINVFLGQNNTGTPCTTLL